MKNQCWWLWHDFGSCKKVDWCPRNVRSGSSKNTVWGKVINRHRKSLQFRSESILLETCRQVRKSVEHTELHFLVELAYGDFQGRMSVSYWNLAQQDDQSREAITDTISLPLWGELHGKNHLEMRVFPFAPLGQSPFILCAESQWNGAGLLMCPVQRKLIHARGASGEGKVANEV